MKIASTHQISHDSFNILNLLTNEDSEKQPSIESVETNVKHIISPCFKNDKVVTFQIEKVSFLSKKESYYKISTGFEGGLLGSFIFKNTNISNSKWFELHEALIQNKTFCHNFMSVNDKYFVYLLLANNKILISSSYVAYHGISTFLEIALPLNEMNRKVIIDSIDQLIKRHINSDFGKSKI